jgi:hypothetical protein
LTEQIPSASSAAVISTSEVAGAPDATEITPAMIEAGVEVLSGFDPAFDT